MAAPRGDYTPRSGPLAGQTFRLQPGDSPTSPYNRYQQARARWIGFQSYQQQKVSQASPEAQKFLALARSQGVSRQTAQQQLATAARGRRASRGQIVRMMINNGYFPEYDRTGDSSEIADFLA